MSRLGGTSEKIRLFKICFLLRNLTDSGGGSAFFDFVPYKFGPFSFSLYFELRKLEARGYIHFRGGNFLVLNDVDSRIFESIDRRCLDDVNMILKAFGRASKPTLPIWTCS